MSRNFGNDTGHQADHHLSQQPLQIASGVLKLMKHAYDALSRLLEADYDSGTTVYTYGYDRAGNLVDMDGATRTYNAAN